MQNEKRDRIPIFRSLRTNGKIIFMGSDMQILSMPCKMIMDVIVNGCLSDESKHIGDTLLRMQFSEDKHLKI